MLDCAKTEGGRLRDDKNTPDGMSVEELAKLLRSTVADIVDKLRKLGVAATADVMLDDDTVRLISGELRRLRERVAPPKPSPTDFWNMPYTPPRVNTQPTAGRHSTETALIVDDPEDKAPGTAAGGRTTTGGTASGITASGSAASDIIESDSAAFEKVASDSTASDNVASDGVGQNALSRTRIPPRDARPDAQRPAPRPLWSAATYRPQYRNALTNTAARRAASAAAAAPTVRQATHKPELITEYAPPDGLIKKVTVYRWPATYNFYEQFRRDAQRYFDADYAGDAPPQRVEFFSYIPQYSQLNRAQLQYYLWWRSRVRAGEYPPADLSYVLLYIYEIINLPEKVDPKSGMAALCDVWAAYRVRYPRIDKYLVEWVADYGLMYGLPAPAERIAPFYSKVIDCCTLKEYYAGANSRGKNGFAASLADFASVYRWRDSKFAQGEALPVFETHIAGAVAHMLERSDAEGKPLFTSDAMRETKVSRDAFCGSLCAYNIKRRIDVEYMSFARSHELRGRLTEAVKYAENRVRAYLKIKSRLNASGIDADCRRWLDEYFDANLPSDRRRRAASADDAPDYERFYDAPAEDGGIERALELERASWSVTDKLVAAGDNTAGSAAGCAVGSDESGYNTVDASFSGESGAGEGGYGAADIGADGAGGKYGHNNVSASYDSESISDDCEDDAYVDGEINSDAIDFADGGDYTGAAYAGGDADEDGSANSPALPDDDPYAVFVSALDDRLRGALEALLRGGFAAYCRETGEFADALAAELNEAAVAATGDIVCEPDADGDIAVVEDYEDALRDALGRV